LTAKILPALAVKSTKSIKQSETYLATKHNQLNVFASIDDLVTDEKKLPKSDRTAIEHHILNLRAAIARELWSHEIYVGRSSWTNAYSGRPRPAAAISRAG
jgi:hypothetical protein